jgi:predicted AlkP superfamily pyrophosphatase or phosphodiesterase
MSFGCQFRATVVVLISVDGFSWTYLESKFYPTPTLDGFRSKGVTAKLHPQFPTKTFPNHYSIITGLNPESHGIVANVFYGPDMNGTFNLRKPDVISQPGWWRGEPLWNVANKSGLITASYFWPGSETYINGLRPNYVMTYDESVPSIKRVEKVLSWLDSPSSKRPSFITMYFSNVDSAGHTYGPDGVANAVSEFDNSLGVLFFGISARQSVLDIHTIIVSDHGMQTIVHAEFLNDYLTDEILAQCDMPDINTPSVNIWVKRPELIPQIMQRLEGMKHAKAYLKEDIPAHLHFKDSDRIAPILIIADIGYLITTFRTYQNYPTLLTGGSHGWDPVNPNMTGIFIGQGSRFDTSTSIRSFQNTEVFNLVAEILHITPPPNNGTTPYFPGILKPRK